MNTFCEKKMFSRSNYLRLVTMSRELSSPRSASTIGDDNTQTRSTSVVKRKKSWYDLPNTDRTGDLGAFDFGTKLTWLQGVLTWDVARPILRALLPEERVDQRYVVQPLLNQVTGLPRS
jgi:hypothetical protein